MSKILIGLSSTEGDRLGHLIRGVQMLRSYGDEAEIEEYSAVFDAPLAADGPSALVCLVAGRTGASPDALPGVCRETEWALGDEPETLTVWLLQCGEQRREAPPLFRSLMKGETPRGAIQVLSADDLETLCDWGQQLIGADGDVIGEWPSATGR